MDVREIEAHRLFDLAPVRSATTCSGAHTNTPLNWSEEPIAVRLRVDRNGRARVLQIGGLNAKGESLIAANCLRQIQQAAPNWRYRPFFSKENRVMLDIVERVPVFPEEVWQSTHTPFPEKYDPANAHIRLTRSACLGFCPSYSLSLSGDGAVVFEGRSDVKELGEHRSQIDPKAFEELLSKFRNADFLSMRDEYEADITDAPRYTLDIRVDGLHKRVVDYVGLHVGMPSVVRALEDEVDRVGGSAKLIGTDPEREQNSLFHRAWRAHQVD